MATKKAAKASTVRTITGTIKAQLGSSWGPQDLHRGTQAEILSRISFLVSDMSEYGYSVVGSAEVVVTLMQEGEMIDAKVEALRAEASKVQAEATAKVTGIQRKIQQLLAITNEVRS